MNFSKRMLGNKGFTLVELMVVVAIIGLLSAVAIPNFRKYQAKSKTSEAKLQLASIYSAMQSFYSDFDNYGSCLNQMGYDVGAETNSRYYATGFAAASATYNLMAVSNGAVAACTNGVAWSSVLAVPAASGAFSFAAGKQVGGVSALSVLASAGYTNYATGFTAGAVGLIDSGFTTVALASEFNINQNKTVNLVRAGY
jgi:type IV pilus assembly protein PilA